MTRLKTIATLGIVTIALGGTALASNFSDTNQHWAASKIKNLSNSGIIRGYEDGSFKPNNTITREEAAVMLSRYLGGEGNVEESTFKDVSELEWSFDSISNLEARAVVSGYPDGTFRPKSNVTRAEFVTMICNMGEWKDIEIKGDTSFSDMESHWSKHYVKGMSDLVNGYNDGTFRPDSYITRAEAATMLSNIIEKQNSLK